MYSKGPRVLEDALEVFAGNPLQLVDNEDDISRVFRMRPFPVLGCNPEIEENKLCNLADTDGFERSRQPKIDNLALFEDGWNEDNAGGVANRLVRVGDKLPVLREHLNNR